MKKLNIAIIGLGNIGSYLYKYLKKIRRFYQKKIIVFQILFMYQLDLNQKKEVLNSVKSYGSIIILTQLKIKMLI